MISKREYVYRLGKWRAMKNTPSGNALARPRRPFSDPEEFYLCLAKGNPAFSTYSKQASLMADGKQDLNTLFSCARAVETPAQAAQLMALISGCIKRSGGDGDGGWTLAYLGILRGYILHQTGRPSAEVRKAVDESAGFLLHNGAGGPSLGRQRIPYVIDIPKLMLFDYGLRMSNTDPEVRNEKVLELLLEQLPAPGNSASCESIVHDCLNWALERLSRSSASRFPTSILAVPCMGVEGASTWKAIAHVFSFLLSEQVAEPGRPGPWRPARANSGLRISPCDLLAVLVALILTARPSRSASAAAAAEAPDFARLCASPPDLIAAARERARGWASRKDLLTAFLHEYAQFTYPVKHSGEEQAFLGEVFVSARKVMEGSAGGPRGW